MAAEQAKTMKMTIHPDLYNAALAWAEVEDLEVYADEERELHVNVSGVYPTKEAVNKLMNGILTAYVKAGMPRG